MGKINAGVTVMQDFCRPGSDAFAGYIDYMTREEAQRRYAMPTFNLFNDYMGNPEKSTGLFTDDKDALTYQEKQSLKEVFKMAQNNESMMWQTVISFDNQWLEKNNIYDSEHKIVDERKLKEVTRLAIKQLLKNEGLEQAVWSAGIHYNTDNLHVHIATVEPYPMRKLMLYKGEYEVRGKFKYKSIEKCKSIVVNEIMQTKEINQRINHIIRKDIVERLKDQQLVEDPSIQSKFFALCNEVLNVPGNVLHYNNRIMGDKRKQIDEISNIFLREYCPEKHKEFLGIVEQQSRLYAEAYGGGNTFGYKEDKINDLMERMGNAILSEVKRYNGALEVKTKKYLERMQPTDKQNEFVVNKNGSNFSREKIELPTKEEIVQETREERKERLLRELEELREILYPQKENPTENKAEEINRVKELAEEGYEHAQVRLGFEHIKGENVEKDLFQAKEWFEKAAEQGNETAAAMLNDMTVTPRTGVNYNPMGELNKALVELQRSFYEAQRESQKNLLIYEQELEEDLSVQMG